MSSYNNYNYHNANAASKDEERKGCCSISCLKFSLYMFNVLYFLTGLAVTGVGLWTLLEKHPSLILLTSGFYDLTAYILIVAGLIILCVTVIGCCGISRGNHCLVSSYSVLLSIIILAEAIAGSMAYLYRTQVKAELSENLEEQFNKLYGINNDTTFAVDHLQLGLKCCGVHDFDDWTNSEWYKLPERKNNKVPDSCCISPSLNCGVRDGPSNIRYTGCIDRVDKIAGDHLIIVGAVAIGVCLVQLVGAFMACLLYCRLRDLTHYG